VPDTFSAIYEYGDTSNSITVAFSGNDHYGYGEQLCGNEGTIEVMNRQTVLQSRNAQRQSGSLDRRPPAEFT